MIRRSAAVVLSVLLLAACAGTDAPEAAPGSSASTAPSVADASAGPEPSEQGTVVELTYADGEVSGDTGRVEVPLGGTVVLRVTSDVQEEIHVHGVDEYVDLPAGRTTEASFVADIPGVFEVELHGAGTLLTKLQVQ